MPSRFLRAFPPPVPDPTDVARAAAAAVEHTGVPYLVVVDVAGEIKHFTGPSREASLKLVQALQQPHVLKAVEDGLKAVE